MGKLEITVCAIKLGRHSYGQFGCSRIVINFGAKIDERMTITVEILDQHALNLLRELERMHAIRLFGAQPKRPHIKALKKEFNAVRLDTRGFKFNREEANER